MDESYRLVKNNQENGALLPDMFGVVDVGRILYANYEDKDLQNGYEEGHTGNV